MIKAVNIQDQVVKLNKALTAYVEASGKSLDASIPRQGGKLALAMYRRLKDIAPPKGQIRRLGEGMLRSGRGIRVRKSIRDSVTTKFKARFGAQAVELASATSFTTKQISFAMRFGAYTAKSGDVRFRRALINGKNWWQLAAATELSARESARGFLSITPPRDASKLTPGASVSTKSRWGRQMAIAGYQTVPGTKTLKLAWGTQGRTSEKAAEGLTYSQRAKAATAAAIADTTADMEQYIARKLAESLTEVKP